MSLVNAPASIGTASIGTVSLGVGIDTARYGHHVSFLDEQKRSAAKSFHFTESSAKRSMSPAPTAKSSRCGRRIATSIPTLNLDRKRSPSQLQSSLAR